MTVEALSLGRRAGQAATIHPRECRAAGRPRPRYRPRYLEQVAIPGRSSAIHVENRLGGDFQHLAAQFALRVTGGMYVRIPFSVRQLLGLGGSELDMAGQRR
jgi:hypothetical protein